MLPPYHRQTCTGPIRPCMKRVSLNWGSGSPKSREPSTSRPHTRSLLHFLRFGSSMSNRHPERVAPGSSPWSPLSTERQTPALPLRHCKTAWRSSRPQTEAGAKGNNRYPSADDGHAYRRQSSTGYAPALPPASLQLVCVNWKKTDNRTT